MTSAIAKELPPYRLDTVNSRHAGGERFRVHVLGRLRLLGGDTPITIEKWSGRWESNPHGRRLRGLQNKQFGAVASAKCDVRVNFCGMWGQVRLCSDTWMCEIPLFEDWGCCCVPIEKRCFFALGWLREL